jgi:hypothetical protein
MTISPLERRDETLAGQNGHPGPETAPLGPATLAAIDELARTREAREREEASRGWRALMLATDIETYEALMRGERVPRERLDPLWLARFGGRL